MIGGREAGLAAALVLAAACPAAAHQYNVFALADCDAIEVEATLESGLRPRSGEVRLLDDTDTVIRTLDLGDTGTKRIPIDGLNTSGGLRVEVDAGDHSDYWILTPEDIARSCTS